MPTHYINQCVSIVNCASKNNLQWHFSRNEILFIDKNAFDNVVWNVSTIFFWSHFVSNYDLTVVVRVKLTKIADNLALKQKSNLILRTRWSQVERYSEACSGLRAVAQEVNEHVGSRGDGHQRRIIRPCFRSFRPKELLICTYNPRTCQYVGCAFIVPQLRCRGIHTCNTRTMMIYHDYVSFDSDSGDILMQIPLIMESMNA